MNLTLSGGLDVRSQSAELKARSKTSLYKLLGVREDEPYPGKPDPGAVEPFPVSRIKCRELYEGR
jgi:hypothetical protein